MTPAEEKIIAEMQERTKDSTERMDGEFFREFERRFWGSEEDAERIRNAPDGEIIQFDADGRRLNQGS